jgi:diaminopimelate epimerase
MISIKFIKMHGLGNDFVVVDARSTPFNVTKASVFAMANRHTGLGFDQLITIEPSNDPRATAFMRIHNSDGSEVSACGNAIRCVARLLFEQTKELKITLETSAGLIIASHAKGNTENYIVDMGLALHNWWEIPLSQEYDTDHLPLTLNILTDPVAVNIGNPHIVFFTEDVETVPLHQLGPKLEHHSLFPQRVNIGVAQIINKNNLRLRVWERGAGLTQACGTGACAAAIAANRRGLTNKLVKVNLDGGNLDIELKPDGRVFMTGPASICYKGEFDYSFFDAGNKLDAKGD